MRSLSTFVSLLVTSTLALAQGMPAGVPVKGTPVEVQGQPMQGGDMQMDGPQDGAPMDLPPGFDKVEPLSKSWTKDETSADAVAKGQALIDGLVKAYTTPVAVQDKISLTMKIPGNDQTQDLSVGFGPDNSAMLTVPGMQLTRLGDDLYMEVNDAPTKYLKVTKAGTLSEVMASVFGGASMPLPELQLRGGDASKAADAVGSMFVASPKVTGFRAGKDGSPDLVLMSGEGGGEMQVSIDPKGGRLAGIEYSAVPPGAPAGLRIAVNMKVTSTAYETNLPTPIAFDAKGRKAVDSPDKLQMSLDTGGDAPDLKLKTSDGTEVSLASLKGSVVIIDFWATWCGPCMKGLPKLDEFAKWAAASGKPIKVFGINTMEEDEGTADRMSKIDAFWKKKALSFPTLVDADNSISKAYGVQGIPFTVVIDPQSKIADVHMGLVPTLVEDLKKASEAALAAPAAVPASKG